GSRVKPQVRGHNGFLDHRHQVFLPWLNRQGAVVFHVDAGYLLERRILAIIIDHHTVQDRRVRTTGPDFVKCGLERINTLEHPFVYICFDIVHPCNILGSLYGSFSAPVTHPAGYSINVPSSSPLTMRLSTPGLAILKPRNGMP